MTTQSAPPGTPLLATAAGVPIVYPVLGAMFHLEALGPDDADALAATNAAVVDWFGPELRWTLNSSFPMLDPFRLRDLDFLPGYADAIRVPAFGERERDAYNILFAATFGEFALAYGCSEEEAIASPFSYRFYSEMHVTQKGGPLHTCAMIRITVPVTCPLGDFRARVMDIAAKLPVRWGAAGYMYSAWEMEWYTSSRDAIYAHSRRHNGYDVGQYPTLVAEWYERIRTVSWLTFIGPHMALRLREAGRALAATGRVRVGQAGKSLVLMAGEQPEEGDVNRLWIPPAYAEADEMVRPLRARRDVNFMAPWTEETTEKWLGRFEQRLS